MHAPAISTVHAVLDRHGLVRHRRRRPRRIATGTRLSWPTTPNALWCADYTGEFVLGNRRYGYPLTVSDFASRYLLVCEALSNTQERYAFPVFERAFQEFGLPLEGVQLALAFVSRVADGIEHQVRQLIPGEWIYCSVPVIVTAANLYRMRDTAATRSTKAVRE